MILNYLRSFDYFGHPVLLHFGRDPAKKEDGNTKIKTIIGAIYSICLRTVYLIAIWFSLTKMINATDNSLQTVTLNANWDALMKA